MRFVPQCCAFCLLSALALGPARSGAQQPGTDALPPTPAPTHPAPAPSSQSPSGASSAQAPAGSSEDQVKAEEKQRLLGIMPAFNTVQSGSAAPLRASQKFDLWLHAAVDPFTFFIAGLDAGIEQGQNTYPEYGEGALGYAKRFGASFADNVDGNLWGNAILPSLLHQDPRYFRLGHGSVGRRLLYVAFSTVRCKGDNGRWQPSYSNVGGNLIGGAISNLYYPASNRGVGLTLERGLTVTAEGAIGGVAFEFYPDVMRHFRRRHHPHSGPVAPNAPAGQPG